MVQEAQQAVNAVIAQVYSNDTQVIEIKADPEIEIMADIHSTELYVVLLQVSLAALGQLDELMKDNEKVTISLTLAFEFCLVCVYS